MTPAGIRSSPGPPTTRPPAARTCPSRGRPYRGVESAGGARDRLSVGHGVPDCRGEAALVGQVDVGETAGGRRDDVGRLRYRSCQSRPVDLDEEGLPLDVEGEAPAVTHP